ncbi:hypothetical protein B0H19DRAFT_1275291 [Mycena capillaripes]|nr:hypothetical protein B0H19DRAFT_1275291 [Mycena capillaripes]
MMVSSGSCYPTSSSSELDELDAELDALHKHNELLKQARRQRLSAAQQQQACKKEHEEQRSQRCAVDSKRSQWKAASARYYENHPEARERKRLKMAEQRAANKLARRRWDPPRKTKRPAQGDEHGACVVDLAVNVDANPVTPPRNVPEGEQESTQSMTGQDGPPEAAVMREVTAAAESLLFLKTYRSWRMPADKLRASESDDGGSRLQTVERVCPA